MRLSDAWFPLKFHPEQHRLITSTKRYKAVVAGRGSGKSEIAKRYLVIKACGPQKHRKPLYFFVAPTSAQVRKIAWDDLQALIPPEMLVRKSERDMILYISNGAEIHLCSGDKPERLEGVQWDGGIIDESSDEKDTIFSLNLGPAMTHKKAWCWRIGVPKRRGKGAKEFYEFWKRGMEGDPEIDSFHWESEDILSEEEMLSKRRMLSKQDFNEQYKASWESASGLAYPDFDIKLNSTTQDYAPSRTIVVGSDFNVDPMAWILGHYIDGKMHFFDELFLRGTNTRRTLNELYAKYPDHTAGWLFLGDASSSARKTSADTSDYVQIFNDKRFIPKKMRYPKKNPPIASKTSATNGAILNAEGERRLLFHERCEYAVKDMQFRYYKKGTSEFEDTGELGHMADAIGYVCWKFFPLVLDLPPESGGVLIR